MNNIILSGRLTRDPEVGMYQKGGKEGKYAKYTLAVKRFGQRDETDFFNCLIFGGMATYAEKYFHKGNKVLVQGRMKMGSYKDDEGRNIRTYTVIVGHQEYADAWKKETGNVSGGLPEDELPVDENGFMQVPEEGELPFR